MTIGEKIRYCRLKRKLTQEQLAKLSGIHPVSIRKYETMRMISQSERLLQIAKALNINYAAMFDNHTPKSQLYTVGDLNGILLVLAKTGFLLYQEGTFRFHPILEHHFKFLDEIHQEISIHNLRIKPLYSPEIDQLFCNNNSEKRIELELDCQLVDIKLEDI